MQIIASRNSGGQTVRYVTTDALGSADRIIDAAGASLANLSFSAFGSRRGSAWSGAPSGSDNTQIRNTTRRGFTWHEHLDNVGLIHMNGRVYDPAIGRFASADPFVTAPYDSQGLNRYSYVGNNPLSFTDPSGFLIASPNPDNTNPNRPPPTWRGDPWNWHWPRINSRDICGINFCNERRPPTPVPTGLPSGDSGKVAQGRGSIESLISPLIRGVSVGLGPQGTSFLADASSARHLTEALGRLSGAREMLAKPFLSLGTAILLSDDGPRFSNPSGGTADGHVEFAEGGGFGQQTAKEAGAVAIVVLLPASANDRPVSRGAGQFVSRAIEASIQNDGLPVFLRAPRGAPGSLLVVEFIEIDSDGRVRAKVAEIRLQ